MSEYFASEISPRNKRAQAQMGFALGHIVFLLKEKTALPKQCSP